MARALGCPEVVHSLYARRDYAVTDSVQKCTDPTWHTANVRSFPALQHRSMWVAANVRRTGVGGVLVDAVIEWARSSGVNRLLLDVADNNAPAIALYARKGFQPNGEVSTFPPPREHIREHQRELRLS
jgi:GNAT superfamily N-acetyltransferase